MAESQVIRVAPYAGSGDGWGGNLPLRHDYPEEVVLDLERVRFVVPTFLLRVRTFVDWHLRAGRQLAARLEVLAAAGGVAFRVRTWPGVPRSSARRSARNATPANARS